jgi:signal transduction histidine kinase
VVTGATAGRPFVAVANTGPVVTPDEVNRLFEPFQRLSTYSARSGDGLGLGLSIVQAIATAHDAILTARAQPGGVSTSRSASRHQTLAPGSRPLPPTERCLSIRETQEPGQPHYRI